MRGFSLGQISDSDAVRLYEWAERDRAAVLKCTCRQVRRIKLLSELSHAIGGQNLFLHHQVPGLIAEVCGMVVGVIPKEEHVSYEGEFRAFVIVPVDDLQLTDIGHATSIVDDGTSVLRVVESRKALRQTQSRSVQTGTSSNAATPGGIPDCYLMPPQNKASTSANRLDSTATTTFLAPMVPRFEVGDIVKCIGKIQVDRSDDRFLFAQQIARCEDVNAECQHQLDAIDLERRIYRRPFEWSRVAPTDVKPTKSHSSLYRAAPEANARLLISDLSQDEKAVSAPIFETEPERSDDGRRRRLSPGKARRMLSGHASSSQLQPDTVSETCIQSPHASQRSKSSRSSESSTRQLRAHSKIPDQQLTEAFFQLQLQQYISQHYRDSPFAVADLRSDATLSSLAQRIVRIRLQQRRSSRSGDRLHDVSVDTTEQQPEKVRRLFDWAMRKMMQDGYITLADSNDSKPGRASRNSDASAADLYHLATPEYLLRPLNKLLGNTVFASSHDSVLPDVDALTARLRILDDRFRFVDRSLVQDSLALYHTRFAPIVID